MRHVGPSCLKVHVSGKRSTEVPLNLPFLRLKYLHSIAQNRSFRTGNEWTGNSDSVVDCCWQWRHEHAVCLLCCKSWMKGLVHDRKHHWVCACLRLHHYHCTDTVTVAILSVVRLYLMTLSRWGPEFWLDGPLLDGGKSRMLSVLAPRSGVQGRRAGLTSLSCMSHLIHTTATHTHSHTSVPKYTFCISTVTSCS